MHELDFNWEADDAHQVMRVGDENPLRVLLRDEDGVDVGVLELDWRPVDQVLEFRVLTDTITTLRLIHESFPSD